MISFDAHQLPCWDWAVVSNCSRVLNPASQGYFDSHSAEIAMVYGSINPSSRCRIWQQQPVLSRKGNRSGLPHCRITDSVMHEYHTKASVVPGICSVGAVLTVIWLAVVIEYVVLGIANRWQTELTVVVRWKQ